MCNTKTCVMSQGLLTSGDQKKKLYHGAMCIGPTILTSIVFSYWVHKQTMCLNCEELKSMFEVARNFVILQGQRIITNRYD